MFLDAAVYRVRCSGNLYSQIIRAGLVLLMLVTASSQLAYGQTTAKKGAAPPKGPKGMPKGYEKIVAVTLPAEIPDNVYRRGLVRELGRQALLIAAESELGLITLDRSIGEVIPTGTVARGPFIVNTVYGGKGADSIEKDELPKLELTLMVTRYEQFGAPFQWSAPAVTYSDPNWLESYVEHVESLSRGPLVEALKKAGYVAAKSTSKDGKPGGLKDETDLVSQFALLRSVHSQLQVEETPELLGDLIRSYAKLGSVTDNHWSPASKAYKARSLVYAQRLIAKYERTPFSLAHRAFALALAGRHATALAAVQEAKDAKGTAAPDWLPLIEAYCSYDTAVLERETEHAEFASYLRLRMLDLYYDEAQSAEKIFEDLPLNHGNTRIVELLPEIKQLGVRRNATEVQFLAVWPHIFRRIALIPNLPSAAKTAMEGPKNRQPDLAGMYTKRKELMGQLQFVTAIKNQPGPYWPALADLLKNVSLIQAWHTLDVQSHDLGVDTLPTWNLLKPTFQGHHFEKALLIFAAESEQEFDALRKLAADPDGFSCEVGSLMFYKKAMNIIGEDLSKDLFRKIILTADSVYEDDLQMLRAGRRKNPKSFASISPHWPPTIAYSILHDNDQPLAELEQKYSNSGYLLNALYTKYASLNQLQDALRCLKKSVELAPSCDGYRSLAAIYKSQGDTEAWHRELLQALEQPNLGLEHASIEGELAVWHMSKSEWDQAEPHARAAAASFSNWGLAIGVKWAEGAGNWESAEQYTKHRAFRYGPPSLYLLWCQRTGHGDLAGARKLAADYWNAFGEPPMIVLLEKAACTLVAGDRQKAKEILYECFSKRADASAGLYLAVLADEEGDVARRDKLFRELETTMSSQTTFIELSDCFRGVLSGKESGRWNPRVLDLLATKEKMYPAGIYFLAGTFLGRHDQPELSELYLRVAANHAHDSEAYAMLADAELQTKKLPKGKPANADSSEAVVTYDELTHDLWKPLSEGRLADAEDQLNLAIQKLPGFIPARLTRAVILERQERYEEAIAELEQIVKQDPGFYYANVQLARILSTCDKAEVRNGKKALAYAEKAAEWRHFDSPLSLSVLASAQAESGNFAKAVELETRARALTNFEPTFESRLALYKARKPYHVKNNTLSPDATTDLSWRWR